MKIKHNKRESLAMRQSAVGQFCPPPPRVHPRYSEGEGCVDGRGQQEEALATPLSQVRVKGVEAQIARGSCFSGGGGAW